MWHVCKWVSVFIIIAVICPVYAADVDIAKNTDDTTPVVENVPQNLYYDKPDNMPFITINTDSALDLNWAAALEFSDPALRPTPVTLPFLTDYPINNLEVKFRVLNLKF